MKKVILSLGLLMGSFLYAQSVPQAFNYQGIARDASGTSLASKTLGVRITLQEISGNTTTNLYQETHSVTTNAAGLFNLAIGRGTATLGTFAGVDFANKNVSVKTEIDPNGGSSYSLNGTSQLLSVPYALVAGSAVNSSSSSSIWSGDATSDVYLNSTGKVGIGTSTPSAWLDIKRYGVEDDRAFLNITNTNTKNNDAAAWMGISCENENGIAIGHHGINYDLTPNHSDLSVIETSGKGLAFKSKQSSGFLSFIAGGAQMTDEKMRITSTGNVGIGTSVPKSKLQITSGDVYIDDATKGIIMKSPNGGCWRVTVDNSGGFKSTSITCP